jgi:hypothetical protein
VPALGDVGAFTLDDLRRRGFVGFDSVRELTEGVGDLPATPGVYAVVRVTATGPRFLADSPASWFKGKDPTVTVERLNDEWVAGAQTVYIGSGCNLAQRVGLLIAFSNAGATTSIFHWGGRLLWQLEDSQDLLVGWMSEPTGLSSTERDLVDEFVTRFGRMPYANLKRPPIRECP